MPDLHPYTRSAIASVRLEGGDVADADAELIDRAVRGEVVFDQVVGELFNRHGVALPAR